MTRKSPLQSVSRESELDELRARLTEAEETLSAIRNGEVDALLLADPSGDRLYTLRSADAPYRVLVEHMREGAATLTVSGDIIYCNKRFAELMDAPLQQVIGRSIDRFIMDAADRATLERLVVNGAGQLRMRLRHAVGHPIDVHVSVSSVTLEGIEHRILIATDISTLMKAQRESRSKDEFLAMLAHELRNPLGAIGGAAQVLGLTDLQEPRAIRARDIIQRQVSHMARLMDDLLDVGRVVTGKIVLERRPIDLAESVRAYVTAIASGEQAEGRVKIETESLWVFADPVRVEQITANLLSNALKFTPVDRHVRVSVKAEGTDVVLSVADEGIGIDPELLPHIFDLFVQADDSSERSKGGLGIGLTLVRRLAELHGGTVEASSAGAGQGSTFTVRLPKVPQGVEATSSAPTGQRPPSRRVLLVDDNADAREMYCLALQADGHDVYEAADGHDALELFRRWQPEVAIIDIGLPSIDGYEVARQIRAEPQGQVVTLIALTGYGFPEDRERSRDAGFDRHLVKPAAPDDLRRELSDFADRPRNSM